MSVFTPNDLEQIKHHDQTEEKVLQQVRNFETGFPFLELLQPATKENQGILSFENINGGDIISFYEEQVQNYQVVKFVPASGAAS